MRIRTARYIVKEGVVNAYRNKLMSLASVIIVIATLVIFGFFMLIALNLELNLNVLRDQPQLEVFCYSILDDTQVKQVEESIKNNDKIAEYQIVTKQQALEKMRDRLGKGAVVLDGYDENIFPVSYIIKLKDTEQSTVVVNELENISGVETVSYSQDAINVISKISYWVKFVSVFMIVVLLIVSVFIISNTIKLTVFARRREINIMKFIGATDWFIRWPFVVEGVIIGIVGAIVAFILSTYGYNAIEGRFSSDFLSISTDFLKLIKMKDVWYQIFAFYSTIGIVVGALGSILSIRRYLKV
jgi:cell division transport system permease protein